MYKGIVFDFDGVLYDSEKHWAEVENPYLKSHIPEWKDAYYAHLIGKSTHSVYEYLVKRFGLNLTREQYMADYEEMAQRLYGQKTTPLEKLNLIAIVQQETSVKAAIASSSKPEWIMQALRNNPVKLQFATVVTAHDHNVKHGKPAPDVYLEASRRLCIKPGHLIAIEDSATGVASAKSAGLYCIGLVNGFNLDQDLSQADETFDGYSNHAASRLKELLS